jgi:aspartyl-tRNA(Asn)/glutamyl-tRNA(Gln) amidotransferase subunit A
MPLAHSLDTIGPLARSAEDCALVLAAIAGHDARDPLTSHAPLDIDLERPARSLKVALSSAWIERNAHPEVAAAVLAAAKVLGNLREVDPPPFDTLSAHCLVVMQAEASAQHAQWMRARSQDYSSAVRARLEAGFAIPAAQYLEVLRLRSRWLERWRAMLADADLYLCPAIAVPIPTREETGPRGGAEMPRRLADVTRLTRWVNYLGVPSLALPCGFDSRGLPIGMQLVGRPFAEGVLLAAGHRYQQETDWHRRLPPENRGQTPS